MIQSVTLPVDGGNYTLPSANVLLQTAEGFGPPDPKIGDHEYSYAHGGIFGSQFYQTRRITLGGMVIGADLTTYAAARRELERAFIFNNAEKLMQFVSDDGVPLQCNVVPATKLDLKYESVVAASWQVELDAKDPIFYSQDSYSLQVGITTVTGGITFPAVFPIVFSSTLNNALSVVNNGNARVFPTSITITGPGTNFIITNQATGINFLYNDTLIGTDSVVFDFKNRTAYKNGTINVYDKCGTGWFDLLKGANTITFTCGSGQTSDTRISISWQDGYFGQ